MRECYAKGEYKNGNCGRKGTSENGNVSEMW